MAYACIAIPASAAHALTSCGAGCITANEDDYTVAFNPNGFTLSVDAAHGLLANDDGPASTVVDLPDTVDDYPTSHHLVTTDQGFTVNLNSNGSFTYQSDGTFSGVDSFTYYIWDSLDHTVTDFNSVVITITPVIKPVTFFGAGVIDEPAPGVLANSIGVDPLSLTMDSTSANGGTVVDNGSGAFTYTPPAGPPLSVDHFNFNVYDIDDDNAYNGTVYVTSDSTPPVVSFTGPHGSVSFSPSFTVSWHGSDSGGAGFSHYDVEEVSSAWNGTYGGWAGWHMGTTSTSAPFTGSYGHSYCFRVRAVDNANNTSPWSQTCISVPLKAGNLSFGNGWHKSSNSAYFGGGAYYTTTRNARASLSGVHTKHLWLVTTQSRLSGVVQVQWNGAAMKNVNLYNSTTIHRRLLLALSFSSARTGTLTLKSLSSGKYVTLEGVDVFLS
jgi:hypothetical protein